jgi:hypothetical protein
MTGRRPILSDKPPKTTYKGVETTSATAIRMFVSAPSTLSTRSRKNKTWNCAVYKITACPTVAPKRAIRMRRRFRQFPKASLQGRVDDVREAFICA